MIKFFNLFAVLGDMRNMVNLAQTNMPKLKGFWLANYRKF